MGTFG
jgi:hypothetical protein